VSPANELAALRVDDALWILEPIARKLRRRYPVVEHDALVSVGYIALCRAAETFDATLGVPFSSYGWTRVFGATMDVVRRQLTRSSRTHHAGAQALALLDDPGNVMRDDEQRHRATAREQLATIAAAMRVSALSAHSAAAAQGEQDEQLDQERAQTALDRALQALAPEQARLIEQHYRHSVTLRSIAEQLGVSYRTAKRRHNEALRALAAALRRQREGQPGAPR